MEIKNNSKRQVVWQDIKPANFQQKDVIKSPEFVTKKIRKQIHLPKISKKVIFILLISITIIGTCLFVFIFINKPNNPPNASSTQANDNAEQSIDNKVSPGEGTPDFKTILPTGKNISEFGGWTLISPKGTDPVYTYVDKVDGVSINVSEQKLPENFKDDIEQNIENLAISFNADEKISTNDLIIHIGTSVEGPQSIIFNKNDLLILIKSDTSINNNQWIEYINSLQ